MTGAVLSHSIFVFQSPLPKGCPNLLELYKQYQTVSSQKKKGQVAAQKAESSSSSSGMFIVAQCVGDVSTV
jgi:hypothetical protein